MAIVSILRPIKYNPDTGKYEQNIKVVNSGGQIVNDIQIIETEQVPSISGGITGGSGSLTLITEDLTNSMEDGKLTYTLSNTYNANSLNVYYCGLNITKDLASKSSNGFTLISDYSSIIKAPSGDSSLFVVYTIGSSSGSVDYIATVDINTGTTGSVDLSTQVTGSLDISYISGALPVSTIDLSTDTVGSVDLSTQVTGSLDISYISGTLPVSTIDLSTDTVGSVDLSTQVTGSLDITRLPSSVLTGSIDLSTQVTGSLDIAVLPGSVLFGSVDLSTQVTGSLDISYISGTLPVSTIDLSTNTVGSVDLSTQVTGSLDVTRLPSSVVTGSVDLCIGVKCSIDLATHVKGSLDSYYLTGNYIQNLSEDASPQLGGNLDLNGFDIIGTGDVNINGSVIVNGSVDFSSANLSGVLSEVVDDLSPQLGGDLDVNGFAINGIVKINDAIHEAFSTINAATGTVTHNCSNGHIFYHTNPSADWTSNFTNLDLSTNYATNISLVISQGVTPRISSGVQISGSSQTIYWQGGSPPTGTASGKDVISFSILNVSGSYLVLGQLVEFS